MAARLLLIGGMLLAGCASQLAPATSPAPTVRPTADPTPRVTPETAWPAGYADAVCTSLVELGIAAEDLAALEQAIIDDDLNAVALHAIGAMGMMESIVFTLERAPSWPPGDAFIAEFRRVAEEYVEGLEILDAGAQAGDWSDVDRGYELALAADAAAEPLADRLDALRTETGLDC